MLTTLNFLNNKSLFKTLISLQVPSHSIQKNPSVFAEGQTTKTQSKKPAPVHQPVRVELQKINQVFYHLKKY
jgi:hypothetical protein